MDFLAGTSGDYFDRQYLNQHLQAGGADLRRPMLWRLLELAMWQRSLNEPSRTGSGCTTGEGVQALTTLPVP